MLLYMTYDILHNLIGFIYLFSYEYSYDNVITYDELEYDQCMQVYV